MSARGQASVPLVPIPRRQRERFARRRPLVALVVVGLLATVGLIAAARQRPVLLREASAAQAAVRVAAATAAPASLAPAAVPSASPSATAEPAPPVPGGARRTPKKGISTYEFDGNAQALGHLGARWYYNWSAVPTAPVPGVEFVPMVWGRNSLDRATLAAAKAPSAVLLGFNEPDFASQSNIPVGEALDLWPRLMATGARLGSPAPATGAATPGGWLDRFMSGAAQRGHRVDFIAVHWYGSDFSAAAVGHLRGYLQAVWDRYHKPIWLTEYALMRWEGERVIVPSQQQQVAFVQGSTAMLESLPFVERYAWFSLPAKSVDSTGLYSSGTTMTQVGVAYRAAG